MIASQDRDLQAWIRQQIGLALLYLHNVVPHLEEPSEASKRFLSRKTKASTKVSSFEDKRLSHLKQKEGLVQEPKSLKIAKKLKKKGGPNPLSCKKKKSMKPLEDKLRKMQGEKAISKKPKLKMTTNKVGT